MHLVTDEDFEAAIDDAIESIPARFIDALDNVVIVAEDEPTLEDAAIAEDPLEPSGTMLGGEVLGLYDGISLTERGEFYDMAEPDVITIFKGPHERMCNSREQIVEEIAKTVIHEIGHHFGLSDERLHEMGY